VAKHKHLVLDLERCDVVGIALPAEAGGGTGTDPRIREDLQGTINSVNKVFTTLSYIDRTDPKKSEWVYYNGILMREGVGNDYVASESGGAGTGYDTITFDFAPKVGDSLEIIYIPVP